ncbi:MAG: DinB family protein [Phycisphaerales bacterium]|nr:DinB family protein [Phycisphaerales bacterium]
MANALLQAGLDTLTFSRKAFMGLIDSIPEDKLLHQPSEGANHAMWIMGHLACTDEFFMNKLGDRPFNRFGDWEKIFFMGSKPSPNASDYPSANEVRETMANNREQLVSWVKPWDESKLLSPLPGDLRNFATSHASWISTLAWHEGMHTGQLAAIRKSLGLTPVLG